MPRLPPDHWTLAPRCCSAAGIRPALQRAPPSDHWTWARMRSSSRLEGPGRRDWVVADFGLCRDIKSDSPTVTNSGVGLGTTRYMAPEQSERPHHIGPTADVYSLGCVLYHCLTGEQPGIRQLDYDKLPDEYRPVVAKATALHRQQRYKSASEFQVALEVVQGLQPRFLEQADRSSRRATRPRANRSPRCSPGQP